jgi:N utilization substance protein B
VKASKNARRRARVLAVQALYQIDVTGIPPEQALATALRMTAPEPPAGEDPPPPGEGIDVAYAEELVRTVCNDRARYDALITGASANWRIDRIGRLDAQILRVGAAELARGSAPRPVVIDEAVEIAREYCGDQARAFVNGVLDGIARSLATSGENPR